LPPNTPARAHKQAVGENTTRGAGYVISQAQELGENLQNSSCPWTRGCLRVPPSPVMDCPKLSPLISTAYAAADDHKQQAVQRKQQQQQRKWEQGAGQAAAGTARTPGIPRIPGPAAATAYA